MEDRYEIRVYDWYGRLLSVLDTWRSLSVNKKINAISNHTLSIDLNDVNVPYFIKDHFVEVRRRNELLDWYTEYVGFHRTPRRQITETGQEVFTSYGRSFEDLLKRRSLAYHAPYGGSGPADNVMKDFVSENCGSLATPANGRLHNGVFTGFSVDPLTSQAPSWAGDRTYRNLLDVIQEIATATQTDFAVVANGLYGTFLFKTYNPLGQVRALVFSPEFGNVNNPDFTVSATEEYNTIIALGNGEGPTRQTLTQSATTISDTPWNDIELTRDSRNDSNLQSIIDAELIKGAAKTNFSFNMLQTSTSIYGRDYQLGDYITVRMGDTVVQKRVLGADILVNDTTNSITFDFGDKDLSPRTPNEIFTKSITNLNRRMQTIEHSGLI